MNAYDRGDYNSSFALRAVELKRMQSGALQHVLSVLTPAGIENQAVRPRNSRLFPLFVISENG